jgi:hypothetical protein
LNGAWLGLGRRLIAGPGRRLIAPGAITRLGVALVA